MGLGLKRQPLKSRVSKSRVSGLYPWDYSPGFWDPFKVGVSLHAGLLLQDTTTFGILLRDPRAISGPYGGSLLGVRPSGTTQKPLIKGPVEVI